MYMKPCDDDGGVSSCISTNEYCYYGRHMWGDMVMLIFFSTEFFPANIIQC